jgi:hypothetical protein
LLENRRPQAETGAAARRIGIIESLFLFRVKAPMNRRDE